MGRRVRLPAAHRAPPARNGTHNVPHVKYRGYSSSLSVVNAAPYTMKWSGRTQAPRCRPPGAREGEMGRRDLRRSCGPAGLLASLPSCRCVFVSFLRLVDVMLAGLHDPSLTRARDHLIVGRELVLAWVGVFVWRFAGVFLTWTGEREGGGRADRTWAR